MDDKDLEALNKKLEGIRKSGVNDTTCEVNVLLMLIHEVQDLRRYSGVIRGAVKAFLRDTGITI